MKLQLVGCSHNTAPIEVRERLAFSREQIPQALSQLRTHFPNVEAVLLSTCNRVELYTAAEDGIAAPSDEEILQFLADFHGLRTQEFAGEMFWRKREEAVRHLFCVAASLDSMVVGEAQILAQVKEAYLLATEGQYAGPVMHAAFQSALRVARRVAKETAIQQKRISIPSVAVGDFASQIFERFDDKQVLVIGAGEMGRETLRYLIDAGAKNVTIVNRNPVRAAQLAEDFGGRVAAWNELDALLVEADLVISTTGADEPVVSLGRYQAVESARYERTLFILDLAVPRDFDARIGDCLGVYLYSVDDLQKTCEQNRKLRAKEWPRAQRIIEGETERFLTQWNHRLTGPAIRQLKASVDEIKHQELRRLLNKCEDLDPQVRGEIELSFDRLVNKLLHPPLESLRDEAEKGTHQELLEALKRLFQLQD